MPKLFGKKTNKGQQKRTRQSKGSQPILAGASIFLLLQQGGIDVDQVAAVSETVEALGGTLVHTVQEATHTVFLCGEHAKGPIDPVTLQTITTSQSLRVPVVDVAWVETVAALAPGGGDRNHWSKIDVTKYRPRVLQEAGQKARGRRDSSANLGAALSQTYGSMAQENPGNMEEAALRRAIELSMLDKALISRPNNPSFVLPSGIKNGAQTPHQILGVDANASAEQIKAAYRQKARETHPDKGGDPAQFEAVARSYRTLLRGSHEPSVIHQEAIKNTAHWDNELRDHQTLVNELFQSHRTDLAAIVAKMEKVLNKMSMYAKEAGASNINEKNERISNSCFYLSLASSYLHGIGALTLDDTAKPAEKDEHDRSADEALIGETALDLKRSIEAAVVNAHPEWAEQGKVGEEVQAFSDFLVYVLDSPTILSDWAVAVFDSVSGFVDIYKGKNYTEKDRGWAQSNTIALRYVPGHYQPLIPREESLRPDLGSLIQELESVGLFYVVTSGGDPE